MKLKVYAKKIEEMAGKYPELEVIYSRDDEGNGFQTVQFYPSVGTFESGEFESDDDSKTINAVCIN